MPITALYAGLLVPLFIWLSFRVIGVRRSQRVPVGDGGDKSLARRMRVHANFAEYVPMGLLLIGIAESLRTDFRVLHALGIILVAGRLMHAFGMSQTPDNLTFRAGGVMATFAALAGGALACLVGSYARGFGL